MVSMNKKTKTKLGIAIHEASKKLAQVAKNLKEAKDKPAQAGFVYLNKQDKDKLPTIEGMLVLHAHPDDPNLLFVVPLYDKANLQYQHEEHYKEHKIAMVDVPNSVLIANFNLADWMERKNIESWILVDVYSEKTWKFIYQTWRNELGLS